MSRDSFFAIFSGQFAVNLANGIIVLKNPLLQKLHEWADIPAAIFHMDDPSVGKCRKYIVPKIRILRRHADDDVHIHSVLKKGGLNLGPCFQVVQVNIDAGSHRWMRNSVFRMVE
ncbi:hypothetical protein D3C71_998010 [compost metagenome]